MDKNKTGAFICEKRREKKMTQKELAERLHVTDKAVSKWERGLSFPDITLLPALAEALEVSLYELMSGEKEPEKPEQTGQLDIVLSDTVKEACAAKKKQQRKTRRILAAQLFVFALLLFLLFYGKEILNFSLALWSGLGDKPYHSCDITVKGAGTGDLENFYIYKTGTDKTHVYQYHLMGVSGNGEARELAILEQEGMNLDTAPRLCLDEEYLYVLFSGLDNEDAGLRLYEGKTGADIQGFVPVLYRYRLEDGELEPVKLPKKSTSLLIDAFTYGGETYVLEGRFKGLLGGINLGFYEEDGSCLTNLGALEPNLTNDGGMQTDGCLCEDRYLIAGGEGIYEIHLLTREVKLLCPLDLSACVRAELHPVEMQEEEGFALICGAADETDSYHTVKTCRTRVLLFDRDMKLLAETDFDGSVSAVEWGTDSAVVSGVREDELVVSRLTFLKGEIKNENMELTDEVRKRILGGAIDLTRWDELEQAAVQWVYLPSKSTFVLTL